MSALVETAGREGFEPMDAWRSELVESHLNMVRSLASRIHRSCTRGPTTVDDLIGFGTIGLYEAAQSYDPKLGVKFSTYSWYRVRGAIYDGLKESSDYKLVRTAQLKAQEAANEYLSVQGKQASPRNSTQSLLNSLAQSLKGVGAAYVISMDSVEEILPDQDAPSPERVSERRQFSTQLRPLIEKLTPTEQKIIHEFYYNDKNLAKIAEELGHSRSWACRIHKRILDKLKSQLKS